jgi:hypothetical protein
MTWIYKKITRLWANYQKSYIMIEGDTGWKELAPTTYDMYQIAAHSFFTGRNAWIDLGTDGKVYQMAT